ncbi:interferon gamma receptor 1 precursor [Nothobranchius furzeri]|uniref:Interferon gamma receptor 1 n=4 Tax=Nothobranchius TaxID=28779 RepID=A0A8C6P496_NOTFU|nr:interferon gamma receptor 1 precursor [Nothobranchius furzeri]KAF7214419.1 transcript variant X1 [Nothobranchius furzeri]KAF7214420.1 transcript variant X2 [Nothobranchius furzeri]
MGLSRQPVGASTVLLLLLVSGGSFVYVAPPTNVVVSCQNLNTRVSWDYRSPQPRTVFRVTITGSSGSHEENTTEHTWYDLSPFVWRSATHYQDFLYVTVEAVQGAHQSEAIKSQSFSFNNLKTVHKTCVLDFPRAQLDVGELTSVTFENPLKLYPQLNDASELQITAIAAGQEFTGLCLEQHPICKVDVTFVEGQTKCVRLRGVLFNRRGLCQVSFRDEDGICSHEEVKEVDEKVAAIIVGSLFVLVIIVLIVIIWWVKAWSMQTSNLPVILVSKPHQRLYHPQEKVKISPVFLCSSSKSPAIKPSMSGVCSEYHSWGAQLEDQHQQLEDQHQQLEDQHQQLEDQHQQLEDQHQQLEAEGLMSKGTEEDSTDDSTRTDSVSVSSQDEEQQPVSPYDRSHFVEVDMGVGDMVTGYTGE